MIVLKPYINYHVTRYFSESKFGYLLDITLAIEKSHKPYPSLITRYLNHLNSPSNRFEEMDLLLSNMVINSIFSDILSILDNNGSRITNCNFVVTINYAFKHGITTHISRKLLFWEFAYLISKTCFTLIAPKRHLIFDWVNSYRDYRVLKSEQYSVFNIHLFKLESADRQQLIETLVNQKGADLSSLLNMCYEDIFNNNNIVSRAEIFLNACQLNIERQVDVLKESLWDCIASSYKCLIIWAINALSRIEEPKLIVPVLINRLNSDCNEINSWVIENLYHLGEDAKQAIEKLKYISCFTENEGIRTSANAAVERIRKGEANEFRRFRNLDIDFVLGTIHKAGFMRIC